MLLDDSKLEKRLTESLCDKSVQNFQKRKGPELANEGKRKKLEQSKKREEKRLAKEQHRRKQEERERIFQQRAKERHEEKVRSAIERQLQLLKRNEKPQNNQIQLDGDIA